MKVWIFQCNPDRYDLLSSLKANIQERVWMVNQHKDEIKKGDIALLWIAGKKAGIYAVAKIISNPDFMFASLEDDKYWIKKDDPDKGKKLFRVKINIIKNLSSKPVLKEKIRKMEGLKNLRILKYARRTNSPVTKEKYLTF